MELYTGQRIILHGTEGVVVNSWAMGRYRKYVLADGREIHADLDQLVAKGVLHIVKKNPIVNLPKSKNLAENDE